MFVSEGLKVCFQFLLLVIIEKCTNSFVIEFDKMQANLMKQKKTAPSSSERTVFHVLSLLSDSNQRPRDYKSRALAN